MSLHHELPSVPARQAGESAFWRTFLISLLALAFLTASMTWLGLQWSREQLQDRLQSEAVRLQSAFAVALDDIEQHMLTLAAMVAADPQVQRLFREGRDAVLAEGGGPGGARAARARAALLTHLAPQWQSMQEQFALRQLHFHLGPGSLSFLRVHMPEKFGDRMDGVRHIIEDVNRDGRSRTGFETGRVYSGVRGVVAVRDERAPGHPQIGVVEAGTSFDTQLARLDAMLGVGFAILLKQEHVDKNVWQDFLRLNGLPSEGGCKCYLEASSRPEIKEWMNQGDILRPLQGALDTYLFAWEGRDYQMIRYPLHDYLHEKDPQRAHVGSVAIWVDRTHVLLEQSRLEDRILWGGAASFLVLTGLVFWGLGLTQRRLEARIREATQALEDERRLFVGGPVLTLVWAPEGGWPVRYVSENVRQVLGYTPEEMQAADKDFVAFIHPEDRPRVAEEVKDCLARGEASWEQRYRLLHKNGGVRWVYDFTVAEWDSRGMLRQVRGYLIDQTERMELEARLKEQEERVELALEGADLGLWDWHIPSGRVVFNERWAAMIGYTLEEVPPHVSSWELLVHPDDKARVEAALRPHLEGRISAYGCEHRLRHKDGHWIWVLDRGKVMERDAAGQPVRAVGTHLDITAAKEAEETLARTSERYRQVLAAIDQGMWEWDVPGGKVIWDARSYEMLGYAPDAFALSIDVFQQMVHPEDIGQVMAKVQAHIGRAEGFSVEFRIRRADDSWIWLEGRGRAVAWENGEPVRLLGTHTDISARKRVEQALRAAEARQRTLIASMTDLLLALDASGFLREVHQPRGFLGCFDNLQEQLGRDYRAFLPDAVAQQLDEAIAQVMATLAPRDFAFALPLPGQGGERRHFHAHVSALADGEPYPTGYLVVVRDVSESVGTQQALRQQATRQSAMLDGAGEGIYGVDMQGRCTFINQAALDMLGALEAMVLGQPTHALFHHHTEAGEPYPETDCPVALTLADGQLRRADNEWYWRLDGTGLPVSMTVSPIVEDGVRTGAVVLFQDQSQRRAQEQVLRHLATTDELTGLPNRRYFMERLEQEWSRLHRFGGQAAIMMLDLDHFKHINDSHGHGCGDQVLKAFAEVLRRAIRRMDVPGRLGGEEFAVILPGASLDGARQLAERVRRAVMEMQVPDALGQPIPVTVSIGLASFEPETPVAEALLTRVDEALYRAKTMGRNRVEVI
ncbi:PAS domain-containing protein [Azovibrio restrictus]|uniref:PAS domain-containing protein n=1 Tax=Azovibrio restrictus TaxID=146938 RepID=UPI0026EC48E5|nr:PAS domain-containing protein [Azovibrio restrictus]